MNALQTVRSDMAEVFERRVSRAPADLRRIAFGNGFLITRSWLINSQLVMCVGSRSTIVAAENRIKALGEPFPQLISPRNGAALYRLAAGGIFTGGTFVFRNHPIVSVVCLANNRSVIFSEVAVEPFGGKEYSIEFLAAFQGQSDADALLFGPDELESSIVRYIAEKRLMLNAS